MSTVRWGLRQIFAPISQCQWWDPHVDLLIGIPQIKILRHVDTLLFQMNMIWIYPNIFTKYLQWMSSKGKTCSNSGQ